MFSCSFLNQRSAKWPHPPKRPFQTKSLNLHEKKHLPSFPKNSPQIRRTFSIKINSNRNIPSYRLYALGPWLLQLWSWKQILRNTSRNKNPWPFWKKKHVIPKRTRVNIVPHPPPPQQGRDPQVFLERKIWQLSWQNVQLGMKKAMSKTLGFFAQKHLLPAIKGTPNAAMDLWRQCMTWKIGHFNFDMCLINEGSLWFESWTVGIIYI